MQLLAGTASNPSLLNIGILRSILEDKTKEKKAQIESADAAAESAFATFDTGVQLTWSGQKLVSSATGPAGTSHCVSFRFSVAPFVFDVQARDLKDQTTQFISVLTLFLSVMSFMRVLKTFGERLLDQALAWCAGRKGLPAPADVLRRRRVLEEHAITGKPGLHQRRMSSSADVLAANVGAVGGSGSGDGAAPKKPKKPRRLSSRDLIQQHNMHANPMARSYKGAARTAAATTAVRAASIELTKTTTSVGGREEKEEALMSMVRALREQMEQQKRGMEQQKLEMEQQQLETEQQQLEINELKAQANTTATSTNEESRIQVHVDEESGRRYSYDTETGVTQWLEDDT